VFLPEGTVAAVDKGSAHSALLAPECNRTRGWQHACTQSRQRREYYEDDTADSHSFSGCEYEVDPLACTEIAFNQRCARDQEVIGFASSQCFTETVARGEEMTSLLLLLQGAEVLQALSRKDVVFDL